MSKSADQVSDCIIVGSGAAGGWAAKELTERGLSVLLLEAGRYIDKEKDFPTQHSHIRGREGMWYRMGAALRGQSMQVRNASFSKEVRYFYVNDRENPYETPRGKPFNWFRGRQLGGRMHTWARAALRMSDYELKGNGSQRIGDQVWPICYADLAPYYDKIERTLGVHGNRDGLENLPDGSFETPYPLGPTDQLFAERVENRLGLKLIQNRVTKHIPDRIPIPLTLAMKTGRLRIRPDSVVSHVLIDKGTGKAKGVAYVDRHSKTFREVYARVVLLCASAIESVRIMLNSACPQHPEGIGGSSGELGRWVGDHVFFGQAGGVSDAYRDVDPNNESQMSGPLERDPFDFGAYAMYLPNFCGSWGRKPDFVGGYGIQCGTSRDKWWMMAFGEMLPHRENRVSLSPRRKDAWGIPVARIDVHHSSNDEKMILHMKDSIGELAEAIGFHLDPNGGAPPGFLQRTVFKLLSPTVFAKNGAFLPGASIHEIGGARMGDDPKQSVVNPYCQVWDVPNVFVTDGACFVSGGFQNHTLTIMALTARACDFILRELA